MNNIYNKIMIFSMEIIVNNMLACL